MSAVSYIPGAWLGIVRSRTAVLLGPGTRPALIAAVWDLLESRPEVHEVLHLVTSSSGGSLANIPSFGILDFDGPLRVFLRGDLDVTVQSSAGPLELNGRDVTTWTERRLNDAGLCRLTIPAAAGGFGHPQEWVQPGADRPGTNQPGVHQPSPDQPQADLPELPLGEGVVLLQSLALTLGSGTKGAAELGPAADRAGVSLPVAADAAPTAAAPPTSATAGPAVIETTSGAEAASVVSVPVPALAGEEAQEPDLPGITVAPEHGASAETVYAVIDEDFDVDGLAQSSTDTGTGTNAGSTVEPATGIDAETAAGARTPTAAPDPATPGAADQVAAAEMTSSYDHLWERTVVRSIEDAAVREDPETADAETPGPGHGTTEQPATEQEITVMGAGGEHADGGPAVAGAPATPDGLDQPPTGADVVDRKGTVITETPPAVVLDGPPAPSGAAPVPSAPAPGGLIDSVPWRTPAAGSGQAAPPAVPSPMLSAVPAGPAPTAATAATPALETGPAEYDGDHDGQTVMKGSLGRMAPAPVREANDASAAAGPLVLARLCPRDHANPPTNAACAACGAGLLPDAVQVARPRLGRMRISTGDVVDLDQSLVIGRQPSVSRVQGGVMPRLVQVASPGGDISRSHVEVRLEGWHVMLCDLKATNGTILVREGQPPRRLAQNEMAILLDGDIAELGDNISLRFEEIP